MLLKRFYSIEVSYLSLCSWYTVVNTWNYASLLRYRFKTKIILIVYLFKFLSELQVWIIAHHLQITWWHCILCDAGLSTLLQQWCATSYSPRLSHVRTGKDQQCRLSTCVQI